MSTLSTWTITKVASLSRRRWLVILVTSWHQQPDDADIMFMSSDRLAVQLGGGACALCEGGGLRFHAPHSSACQHWLPAQFCQPVDQLALLCVYIALIGWRNSARPLIGWLTLVNRQAGQQPCDVLYCQGDTKLGINININRQRPSPGSLSQAACLQTLITAEMWDWGPLASTLEPPWCCCVYGTTPLCLILYFLLQPAASPLQPSNKIQLSGSPSTSSSGTDLSWKIPPLSSNIWYVQCTVPTALKECHIDSHIDFLRTMLCSIYFSMSFHFFFFENIKHLS